MDKGERTIADDYFDRLKKDKEGMKRYQRERIIMMIGEVIAGDLKEKGLTYTDLDIALGMEEGYIKRILEGEEDISLKELSDILFHLDNSAVIISIPLTVGFEEFGELQDKKGKT
jgi:hypothetical protein